MKLYDATEEEVNAAYAWGYREGYYPRGHGGFSGGFDQMRAYLAGVSDGEADLARDKEENERR